MNRKHWLLSVLFIPACLGGTCGPQIPGPDDGTDGDSGNASQTETLKLVSYATQTSAASGLALRPSDGKLFAVNPGGLFGPIEPGADLSTMAPIGATNLASAAIFKEPQTSFVLAVTDTGEFWIGCRCCSRLAIVPAEGGDAVAFDGLLAAPSEPIKATTLTMVPAGFDGADIHPGYLLAGQETNFSWLSAINVAGDRSVLNVANPTVLNREAQALAFGPGPLLYGTRGVASPTSAGIQTIAPTGAPAEVVGTQRLGARTLVVRANGDLVMLGRYDTSDGQPINGVLLYSNVDQAVKLGAGLTTAESSQDGQMAISADRSTIYLSIPNRNEIVTVEDK